MLYTHQSVTVPVVSGSTTNGGTGEKEERKGREVSNKWNEWKNQKEHGGFSESWYCCWLSIKVSQEL